ncbi:MAG: site-2 protease family protein [bacterium]|nr:site-2 protease family protein [bacterium]
MNLLAVLFSQPLVFLVMALVFLLVLSLHEASHALAAFWLGDMTAKRAGRLTLDPRAHIDWIGLLMLLVIGFGWGKPVPFNPYNLKYPRWGATLVAAAGPLSNFITGAVFAFLFRVLHDAFSDTNLLMFFLQYGAFLSFLLGIFNLIPVPPLDGSKVLLAALANEKYKNIRFFLETRGSLILLALVFLDLIGGVGVFSWISHAATYLLATISGVGF